MIKKWEKEKKKEKNDKNNKKISQYNSRGENKKILNITKNYNQIPPKIPHFFPNKTEDFFE